MALRSGIYENVYEVVGLVEREREKKGKRIFTTRMRRYVLILPNGRIPRLTEVALFRVRIVSLLFDYLRVLFFVTIFLVIYFFIIRIINCVIFPETSLSNCSLLRFTNNFSS